MSLINIGVDNRDASYRYKMPPLQTKIEGRGNGIKTVIVNMTDVAKALHIDPAFPTKYFGIELGAQSKYNESTDRAIVNGAHTSQDMQKMLEKFIQIFVLCPNCKLPEVKMIVKNTIKLDCAACGYNGELKTTHKLAGYIIKEKTDKSKTKNKDKDKDKEKEKDKDKDKDKTKDDKKAAGSDQEDEPAKVAPKKSAPEEDEKKYETFDTDTSKEAQRARQMAEFEELKAKSAANREVEAVLDAAKSTGAADSAVTVLKIFLADPNRTYDQIAAELKRIALSRDLDDAHRLQTLVQALIDPSEPKNVKSQFVKQAKLLRHFTSKEEKGAIMLLNCIEDLTGVVERKLLKFVPHILQALYESDVLSEDAILAWANSPPESSWLVSKEVAQEVRVKAKPFIEWLATAEEDDD